jgi:hypothetical protein
MSEFNQSNLVLHRYSVLYQYCTVQYRTCTVQYFHSRVKDPVSTVISNFMWFPIANLLISTEATTLFRSLQNVRVHSLYNSFRHDVIYSPSAGVVEEHFI